MDFQQRYKFNPKTDLLGKGGFSKVYRATDTLLERTVALKFFTGNSADKYQVLSEIKKVIRLEHPNLCKYYDVEVLSNRNVFGEMERIEVGIMEYIDSGDFQTYTRKNPQHIDKLLIEVLRGLAYLHRHGIAHRDLKAQNILVKTVEGEPISKITDFGISKLMVGDDANSSTLLGTIEYMSPEQFNPGKYGINGRITTNLDMWSFGLLVYETICHEPLFGSRSGGISAEQVMANILGDTALEKADKIPLEYREIVKRCLVKNANERVQNAIELIPLFEKIVTLRASRLDDEDQGLDESADTSKIIRPELPQETDETDETEEIEDPVEKEEIGTTLPLPVEETQFLYSSAEYSSNNTQVISILPDTEDEETPLVNHSSEMSTETQLIVPVSEPEPSDTLLLDLQSPDTPDYGHEIESVEEDKEAQAEITNKNSGKVFVKPDNSKEQAIIKNERLVVNKSPKKLIILSFLAALLIIIFIAYPFLQQRNRVAAPIIDSTKSTISIPLAEDWKPELIRVKGGTFIMGDLDDNDVSSPNYAHEVALSDYSIGKYEVTVAQFEKFIKETGYVTTAQQKGASKIFVKRQWKDGNGIDWRYDVGGNLINVNSQQVPVVHVSWKDADAYCLWLSEKTKETYRLLTEAEWEFAARGGNNSRQYSFSGSDTIDQVGWYQKNAHDSIHLIGTKKPNELGIYDMSGNVLEWCNDWYDKDYFKKSPVENPNGPDAVLKDSVKVIRGGAWAYEAKVSKNFNRIKFKADVTGGSTGFRVAKMAR